MKQKNINTIQQDIPVSEFNRNYIDPLCQKPQQEVEVKEDRLPEPNNEYAISPGPTELPRNWTRDDMIVFHNFYNADEMDQFESDSQNNKFRTQPPSPINRGEEERGLSAADKLRISDIYRLADQLQAKEEEINKLVELCKELIQWDKDSRWPGEEVKPSEFRLTEIVDKAKAALQPYMKSK